MKSTAEARELRELERRFWNAMRDKDGRTAAEMTNDSCIVVGARAFRPSIQTPWPA